MITSVALGLLLVGAASPLSDDGASHEAPERFVFAAKIVAGTSRAAESTTALFGPGLDFEVALVHDWGLELEVAAAALLGDGLTSLPVELLVKKAFHVDRRTDLFVAGGGVSNFVIRDGHATEAVLGAIAVVGAYLWHTERFGLLVEMSYAPYFVDGEVEHDLEGAVGIAHRF